MSVFSSLILRKKLFDINAQPKIFNKLFLKNLQYSYVPSYFHDKMIKDVEKLFGENEDFYLHRMMYPGIGYLLQPIIKKFIVGK